MSILYNGGAAGNKLQLEADIDAVIAGGAAVIPRSGVDFIDLQLINAGAAESATLAIMEFSGATPSSTNMVRSTEAKVSATDQLIEGDLLMVGLATATAYLKTPFQLQLLHTTATIVISIAAESAAGAKYLRYDLGSGMVASSSTAIDNLDLDIGNVGVLDSTDARVDPSIKGNQVGAIGTAMTSVAVNVAAGAATELIAAPAAGHQLWIYGFELHANAQGTIQLLDDTPTAKTGTMPVGAGGGVARDSAYPIFKCATAKALDITAVTCDVDGIITYRDVTL